MTTLGITKLTDTQLIALSAAIQRQDGAVSFPDRIKGMAAQKLATSLMDKGFVREIRAKPGLPAWRRDEDGRSYALVFTKLGRAAVRVADEGRTNLDAVKSVGLPSPCFSKGKRPLASAPDGSDAPVDHAPDEGPAGKWDAARAQSSGLASQGLQCTNGQSVNSPRQGSKLAEVLALLEREAGASIEELTSATGWLPHTTRAALTGLRKRGYTVLREGKAEGGSVYRLTGVAQARAASADAQEEHEQAAGLAGCREARSRAGPHQSPWPRRTSGALADNGPPQPTPGTVARHAGPHGRL